jgi:3-oxoacyl-[acyl-carrier protein] reductase
LSFVVIVVFINNLMKYALVTGGSRGLGRAICLKLAEQGIPVVINYVSNQQAAEEVKQLVEAQGVQAELLKFDTGNVKEVDAALEAWEEAHPDDYIAYLVNNAGIRRDNMMFMMPEEDWHAVLNTSLNGLYYVTRKVLPKMMMRKHGGSIVNMASLSGLKGLPGQTNYSATKAGIIGATKALAQEVAARAITVNAVAPGFIESDMTKDLDVETLKQQVPCKRFGKPEEVADLVCFLLSDKAKYITGEVVSINGGLYT